MIIGLDAGHNARIGAIAFMPLVMAGIHLAFSGKRILGFSATAAGLALHLRENHLQITYYLLLIVLVYGLIQFILAIREKKLPDFLKTLALLVPAAVIAAGTFIGQMWAVMEYTAYTIRGKSDFTTTGSETSGLPKSYTFAYSSGVWETISLLIPDYYGYYTRSEIGGFVADQESETYQALVNAGNEQTANQLAQYSTPYWGPPVGASPYYAGAIVCFIFAIGIAFAERKYVWWLLPLSIFSIMLTWGDNFAAFNYFMFDYFPGYNKFRSVTFALIIVLFAMPLLGLRGLENLLKQGWNKTTQKKLLWPFGVVGGICLILAVTGGFGSFMREGEEQLPAWFTSALREDRVSLLRSDAWRSFWLITIFAGVVFARLKNWAKDYVLILVTIILITFDLSLVDKRFLKEDNFKRQRENITFSMSPADQEILKDKSYYRVYNFDLNTRDPMSEARTSYYHYSIGGYHGAKIRRYQDLYDSCIIQQTMTLFQEAQQGTLDFQKYSSLNMLNVKYIKYGSAQNNILRNPEASGPAWFVRDIRKVNSAEEELDAVCSANTGQTAVIDQSRFQIPEVQYDSTSTIMLVEHQPNYLKYESQSQTQNLAVFSEIYYPKGWKATIDGQEAEIMQVDYILRGLIVPSGKHTLEFRFEPKAYVVGDKVMMASSWILLIVILGTLGWSVWKEDA
jgi:hypothetical protein